MSGHAWYKACIRCMFLGRELPVQAHTCAHVGSCLHAQHYLGWAEQVPGTGQASHYFQYVLGLLILKDDYACSKICEPFRHLTAAYAALPFM